VPTRNILHSCSLIDNKLVPGQLPYVDKKFTNRENATHYIATRCGQFKEKTHRECESHDHFDNLNNECLEAK